MTTDTKAVARWDAGSGVNPRANGKYVLFTDHERVVGELVERHQGYRDAASENSLELYERINALSDALAASRAEVEGLRSLVNGILENRHKCFIPCDDPKSGTFNWDERAAAAMENGNV